MNSTWISGPWPPDKALNVEKEIKLEQSFNKDLVDDQDVGPVFLEQKLALYIRLKTSALGIPLEKQTKKPLDKTSYSDVVEIP